MNRNQTTQPKKLGRPRKLKVLSNAERQQRYRDKRKAEVNELLKLFKE